MSNSALGFVRALIIGAVLVAPSVEATPLIYDEATSGDLGAVPTSDFAFDIGDNLITGTTHFGVNAFARRYMNADFDGFAFTLPSGMRLAAVTFSFVTTSINSLISNQDLQLCAGLGNCAATPADLLGQQTVDLFGAAPMAMTFGLAMPLGSGTYTLVANSMGIAPIDLSNGIQSWSSDYTWTLSVVGVAEPSLAALFAIGVLVLIAQRRPFR
jgi:hypothetical protein